MQVQWVPAIAFAERSERDVVVAFTNGKRALYSAALLHDMIFFAKDLTIRTPPTNPDSSD